MSDRTILITNDDGVRAEGLRVLGYSLKSLGRIVVVAPEQERSASSHAITLDQPLRIKEYSTDRFSVSGTPTDCVFLAVQGILGRKPDLLVSGINHGPNMGEDVTYSGTVAAAIEGSIMGIPSIAISIASWEPISFEAAADASSYLAAKMLEQDFKKSSNLWNVNIPPTSKEQIKGIKVTKLGSRVYKNVVVKKKDPRGKDYFWIGGGEPGWRGEENTDFAAVTAGYISVTPLCFDLTDYKSIFELEGWNLEWKTK
jgi:5'-nucleotidase